MNPHRVHAKFFLRRPAPGVLTALIQVFHSWIQAQRIDGLLIDVANYAHLPEGPGLMLIGHEGDFAFDLHAERPGLQYGRKRVAAHPIDEALHETLQRLVTGAHLLETDPLLAGSLQFRTDEIALAFPDRLHVPNEPASLDKLRAPVTAALSDLYGAPPLHLEVVENDTRHPFTLHARLPEAPPLAALAERFTTQHA